MKMNNISWEVMIETSSYIIHYSYSIYVNTYTICTQLNSLTHSSCMYCTILPVSKDQEQQVEMNGGTRETSSLQASLFKADSIFTQVLEGDALMHFLRALCRVSLGELKKEPPQTYSLQRLTWFCGYNVAAVMDKWDRVWKVLYGVQFFH